MTKINLTIKQKFGLFGALLNTAILLFVIISFGLIFKYFMTQRIKSDLIIESEEIVSQHISIEAERIVYTENGKDLSIEQDLNTDGLSALIFNSNTELIGRFGVFSEQQILVNNSDFIKTHIDKTCSNAKYNFIQQEITEGKTFIIILYPIMKLNKCYGTVAIASNMQLINDIIQIGALISFVVIILSFFLNIYGWKVLSNILLKPLSGIVNVMSSVNTESKIEKITITGHSEDETTILSNTFNAMVDRISEGITKQREFISHASHELKSPISRALSDLDIAELQIKKNELGKARGYIETARNDLKSVSSTISTLLLTTRLNNQGLQQSNLVLSELIKEIADPIAELYKDKSIKLNLNLSQDKVIADKETLYIILRNCLENAYRYTSGRNSITINAKANGKKVKLTIENTINTKENHNKHPESYGLGLSIVNDVCKLSNYTLTIKENINTFTVEILGISKA